MASSSRTSIPITDQPWQGSTEISYTSADAANNMRFVNDGNTILIVQVGTTQTQITIKAEPDEANRDVDEVVTTTSNEVIFGPFQERWWNTPDGTSEIAVDFDQDTDVNVAALRLDF